MPYSKPSDAPDHVPEKHRAQWISVWNATYEAALKDKKSPTEAEGEAFKIANGVAKKAAEGDRDVAVDGPGFSASEPGKPAGPGPQAFPGAVPEMLSVVREQMHHVASGKFTTGTVHDPHLSAAVAQASGKSFEVGDWITNEDGKVGTIKDIDGSIFTVTTDDGDEMWHSSHTTEIRETYMTIERRYASELRAVTERGSQGDEMAIAGYAALFNSPSKDLGGFIETIAPGAFSKALETRADVKCLFNHSADHVLGRTTSGTLTLTQDERGLAFRCMLDPNQQSHRDLHAAVKRGDISECSFAFAPNGEEGDVWEDRKDPQGNWFISRTLRDVKLFDVSAVTYPAYNSTSVQARSINVTPEIRSIIGKLVAKRGGKIEKRDESVEQTLQCISKCLAEQYPSDPAPNGGCCSYGKYWVCDTYDDYVIASCEGPGPAEYVKIPYTSKPDGDGFIFGTPVPVEKEWVPSERVAKASAEFREMKSKHMAAIAAQHEAAAGDHQATADAHTQAAAEHQANADAHTVAGEAAADEAKRMEKCEASMGDCGTKSCRCQNCMVDARDVWDESDEDPDFADEHGEDRAARKAVLFQTRAGDKVRTKKVGGKNLPASAFASVDDPNDTSTWKLPIHDKSHADNAAARLNQTDDIDKEAAGAKIKAAQKKFGEVPPPDGRMSKEEIEDMNLRFHLAMVAPEVRYSDDQPRDDNGKFSSGGSGANPNTTGKAVSKASADYQKSYQKLLDAHAAAKDNPSASTGKALTAASNNAQEKYAELLVAHVAHQGAMGTSNPISTPHPLVSMLGAKRNLSNADTEQRGGPGSGRRPTGENASTAEEHNAAAKTHADKSKAETDMEKSVKHGQASIAHSKAAASGKAEDTKTAQEYSKKANG